MPTKTTTPNSEAKLQFLKKRFNDTIMIAAEKAAAHLLNPQSYPLPAGKNLERALYEVAMALPGRKRDNFTDKFKEAVNTSDAQRKQKYGDLHAVDLRSNKMIAEQVKDIPVEEKYKFTEEDAKRVIPKRSVAKVKLPEKLAGSKLQQASVDATTLQFIVDSLTCTKTNDIHKDEISLGAFATDNFGTTSDKAPFFVGKFKKEETVGLAGNATLFTFSIDGGSTGIVFPATFVAGIFVVEADLIHNAELGNKIANLFSILGLTIGLGGFVLLFVAGAAGPILLLISLFVALGFELLGHYIIPVMIDDFSLAAIDTLTLDAAPAVGDTFNRNLALTINSSGLFAIQKGSYTASARWVAS